MAWWTPSASTSSSGQMHGMARVCLFRVSLLQIPLAPCLYTLHVQGTTGYGALARAQIFTPDVRICGMWDKVLHCSILGCLVATSSLVWWGEIKSTGSQSLGAREHGQVTVKTSSCDCRNSDVLLGKSGSGAGKRSRRHDWRSLLQPGTPGPPRPARGLCVCHPCARQQPAA